MPLFSLTGVEKLQAALKSLLAEGKIGKKAIRKGLRAGAKIVQKATKANAPTDTGVLKRSIRVRAMKRSRKGIGVMVQSYAERKTGAKPGYPYGMGIEVGVKIQPKGARIRKKVKRITVGGRSFRVTDEERSVAYHALAWRMQPNPWAKDAFDSVASQAAEKSVEVMWAEFQRLAAK